MEEIKKVFTEIEVSRDIEGRYFEWKITNGDYNEIAKDLKTKYDAWLSAVRVVEKTFNPETFEIETRVIKKTERTYNNFRWNGAVEIVY